MTKNAVFTQNISITLRDKDVLKRVRGRETLFSAICHGDRQKRMHTTHIMAISYPLEMLNLCSFSSKIMSSISTASKRSIAIWTDNFATNSLLPELYESLAVFTKSSRRRGVIQSTIFKACGVRGLSSLISSTTKPNIITVFGNKPSHMYRAQTIKNLRRSALRRQRAPSHTKKDGA